MKRIFNISNGLSLLRAFMIVPAAYALLNEQIIWVLIIGFLAMVTDFLDGYFARKFHQITEAGKIIDPIADKILVGGIGLILLIQGKLPLWFLLTLIGRDILIMLGGIIISTKIKFVMPSNWIGKWTVTILSLFLLSVIAGFKPVYDYGLYLSLAAIVFSFLTYVLRAVKVITDTKKIDEYAVQNENVKMM